MLLPGYGWPSKNAAAPTKCAVGSYSAGGRNARTPCTLCPPGLTTQSDGSTSKDACSEWLCLVAAAWGLASGSSSSTNLHAHRSHCTHAARGSRLITSALQWQDLACTFRAVSPSHARPAPTSPRSRVRTSVHACPVRLASPLQLRLQHRHLPAQVSPCSVFAGVQARQRGLHAAQCH